MPTSVGWLKFYGFTTTTTTSSAICPFLEITFRFLLQVSRFCLCVKMNAFCVQYFYVCNQSEERKKICIYLPSIFISILIPYHKKIYMYIPSELKSFHRRLFFIHQACNNMEILFQAKTKRIYKSFMQKFCWLWSEDGIILYGVAFSA